jgi:putative membrane protein
MTAGGRRRNWGALTNASRNFAIKIQAIVPKELVVERALIEKLIVEYAFALKRHLRGHQNDSELFISEYKVKSEYHKPNYIAKLLVDQIQALYAKISFLASNCSLLMKKFEPLRIFVELANV